MGRTLAPDLAKALKMAAERMDEFEAWQACGEPATWGNAQRAFKAAREERLKAEKGEKKKTTFIRPKGTAATWMGASGALAINTARMDASRKQKKTGMTQMLD